MRNILKAALAAAMLGTAAIAVVPAISAEMTVEVGGAPMYPSKNIIENAVNSKDHTTLVAAVKAAGLVETLQGPGPFTVFAPVNAAFDALPAGTVEMLLKPENKDQLVKVLTYHVVGGAMSGADLMKKAKAMGRLNLTTVGGDPITLQVKEARASTSSTRAARRRRSPSPTSTSRTASSTSSTRCCCPSSRR